MIEQKLQFISAWLMLCLSTSALSAQQTSDSKAWKLDWHKESTSSQSSFGIQLSGLTDSEFQAIENAGLDSEFAMKFFRVFSDAERTDTPMLGNLHSDGQRLIFEPRFPFTHGKTYRVIVGDAANEEGQVLDATLIFDNPQSVEADQKPGTIQSISPSASELPQNVLRMYLHFDAPMRAGIAYDHIHFLNSAGEKMESPFLEIQQELWSTDRTRLTLLFDPGRIKRGLERHEQLGPPFEVGSTYSVVVDRQWKSGNDANEAFRHSFSIVEPDRIQPAVDRWKVATPEAGSSEPLLIQFDEPLDFGMLQHSLVVVSVDSQLPVEGHVSVESNGMTWRFTPGRPWLSGQFLIKANRRLEDRSGNSLAQPFERTMSDKSDKDKAEPETELQFQIGDAKDN